MNISHLPWLEGIVSQVRPACGSCLCRYLALLYNLESYLRAFLDIWCQFNIIDIFGDCLSNYRKESDFHLVASSSIFEAGAEIALRSSSFRGI